LSIHSKTEENHKDCTVGVAANIRNGNLQNTIPKRCCSSGRTEQSSNGGPVVGHSLQAQ